MSGRHYMHVWQTVCTVMHAHVTRYTGNGWEEREGGEREREREGEWEGGGGIQ